LKTACQLKIAAGLALA